MIIVEPWGPGFHLTLPRHAVHEASTTHGVTLTRAEAVELTHLLFETLGETQRQRPDSHE